MAKGNGGGKYTKNIFLKNGIKGAFTMSFLSQLVHDNNSQSDPDYRLDYSSHTNKEYTGSGRQIRFKIGYTSGIKKTFDILYAALYTVEGRGGWKLLIARFNTIDMC